MRCNGSRRGHAVAAQRVGIRHPIHQLLADGVEIRTSERPRAVRLDPLRLTIDWDRRNDALANSDGDSLRVARTVFDWPFLNQADRYR